MSFSFLLRDYSVALQTIGRYAADIFRIVTGVSESPIVRLNHLLRLNREMFYRVEYLTGELPNWTLRINGRVLRISRNFA